MFIVFCVGSGLCNGLIARSGVTPGVYVCIHVHVCVCVYVCDLETSNLRQCRLELGSRATDKKMLTKHIEFTGNKCFIYLCK